jgi:hypothetical protein
MLYDNIQTRLDETLGKVRGIRAQNNHAVRILDD